MAALSRSAALSTLEEGQATLDELFEGLTDVDLGQPDTLHPGWGAKNLMQHLAFWEEQALEVIDHWRAGRRPPTVDLLSPDGTDQANAENQASVGAESVAELRSRGASAHAALLAALRSLAESEWSAAPPYPDADVDSLGELLGRVLGAPDRPFGHAWAHIDELQTYAQSLGGASSG